MLLGCFSVIKHFPFRHRAAKMTRTIAFYTTFTPRIRDGQAPPIANPPAARRGKSSCPTSQSRFQFKHRNKKKKKKKKRLSNSFVFNSFGREQASVNKNNNNNNKKKRRLMWRVLVCGVFATFEPCSIRHWEEYIHAHTHRDTPWQNVENLPLPRTSLRERSSGNSLQRETPGLRLQHEFTSRSRLVPE